MKPHKIIIVLFIAFTMFGRDSLAQENSGWVNSDITTYHQYMSMEWDSLIQQGSNDLENGIDYYYLRVRMGIAYFKKQNYIRAIRHFNKALSFNPADQLSTEYLYYCYLFTGNDFEAKIWGNRIDKHRKEELGVKNKIIEGISSDFTFSSTGKKNIPPITNSTAAGIQQVPRYFTNANITLKHMPWQRFKLVEGYTFLYKNSLYYEKANGSASELYTNHILQNQLFISGVLYPAKGWQFAASLHKIYVSLPVTTTGNGQGRQKGVSYSTFSNTSYSLSAGKSFGYWDLGYIFTGSDLNMSTQNQHTLSAGIYPFGNLNFYLLNRFIFLNENSGIQKSSFIVGETLGVKLASHFWLEGNILAGDIRNMSDYGSYIIYNDVNTIRFKGGLNLLFPLKSGVSLSLRTNYTTMESSFSDHTLNNTIQYSSVSVTGGISWNF